MREIRTEDAVGHILCHDITQIIKDVKKGVLFKKGHIIREEDIPLLLSVGKEHLYVWEKKEGILHENEGAQILYEICAGDSEIIHGSDIKEGASPRDPNAQAYPQKCLPNRIVTRSKTAVTSRKEFHVTL